MNVYLSLGSNIGDRKQNIDDAISRIKSDIGKLITISKIYKTLAWGFESNNYFLNNVIRIETELNPQELLYTIQEIEKDLGRERLSSGYSDRIIDIDILFYEDNIIDDDNLKIPHSLLQERNFVLYPLNDIAPDFIHPKFRKKISVILKKCSDDTFCELFDY